MVIQIESLRWIEHHLRERYLKGGLDIKQLAELALQLVINRGILEEKLTNEKLSIEERKKVEKLLERLKRLEKFILQTYYSLTSKTQPSPWTGEYLAWKRRY